MNRKENFCYNTFTISEFFFQVGNVQLYNVLHFVCEKESLVKQNQEFNPKLFALRYKQ